MRNILTTILLLAALTVSAQNYSPCYKEKYAEGVELYNKGDYNGAKAKFVAAKGCPMANTKEADTWIGKCNAKLNPQPKQKSTSTGAEKMPKFPTPMSCGKVTDFDGNTYSTVQIGNQCWMAENLRSKHYSNGDMIPVGDIDKKNDNPRNPSPYRYCPNNDEEEVPKYGYLYNWPAAMHGSLANDKIPSEVQGVCPDGWHVPSCTEWTQLTDYVCRQTENCDGRNARIAKFFCATSGWNDCLDRDTPGHNPHLNNATGFSALPAGKSAIPDYEGGSRGFYFFGGDAYFWSTSDSKSHVYRSTVNGVEVEVYYYDAMSFTLNFRSSYFTASSSEKTDGLSVRCLRD